LDLTCLPPEDPLVPVLEPVARTAAERLDLAAHLRHVVICLDDLEPDRRVWLSLERGVGEGGDGPARPLDLTLYMHPLELLRDRVASDGVFGVPQVWEAQGSPENQVSYEAGDLHRTKAERFLMHQFLFARDICDGTLVPELVPRELAEAFQEAWSITVDGRLRRWRMPAASQAQRRVSFSRLFSRHGVLLPDHWRIFHQLWEREDLAQQQVAELAQALPRAPRRPR